MLKKTTTPVGRNRRGAMCICLVPILSCKHNHNSLSKQSPNLGSTARAYLTKYAANLIRYAEPGDKVTPSLIDCCNSLLIEADRLEGGGK